MKFKKDPDSEGKTERKKQTKVDIEDDGRTVSPMDAEWMPWNRGFPSLTKKEKKIGQDNDKKDPAKDLDLAPEEKRAMLRGAFLAQFPIILGLVLVAVFMYFLVYLWLMPK